MVAKDIFPFATIPDSCKKGYYNGIFQPNSPFLLKFPSSGVHNAIFMGKSHEISLFATVSHGCKGKNILCNNYS